MNLEYIFVNGSNSYVFIFNAGSAESWAARAALWAQQRHVEQHYAQQYQQQQMETQRPQQATYPPLPPENAPPLPPDSAQTTPQPPEPNPPGQPLAPNLAEPQPPGDFHEGEPAPPGNDQLYPPGEDPGPDHQKKQTADNTEIAPMEEDDQSEQPNIPPDMNHQSVHHQGNAHHHSDQNNHTGHYGNHPPGEFQHHGSQFDHHPAPYHDNHNFDGVHHQLPPHGGFPPGQYPNDQYGQFQNFNNNQAVVDEQLYHGEPNNYQQYNFNEQQQYGHFDQDRQPEFQQQPKPLLQTEIPISSLPSHVVQAESGRFLLLLLYFYCFKT